MAAGAGPAGATVPGPRGEREGLAGEGAAPRHGSARHGRGARKPPTPPARLQVSPRAARVPLPSAHGLLARHGTAWHGTARHGPPRRGEGPGDREASARRPGLQRAPWLWKESRCSKPGRIPLEQLPRFASQAHGGGRRFHFPQIHAEMLCSGWWLDGTKGFLKREGEGKASPARGRWSVSLCLPALCALQCHVGGKSGKQEPALASTCVRMKRKCVCVFLWIYIRAYIRRKER